jgi:3-hydroxyisobutyrate dehydrogenase
MTDTHTDTGLDVAVLGAGIMGAAMARSLAREGHAVRLWNRSPDKAEAAVQDGIAAAGSVREAVKGADAVLTVLFDADSVLAVTEELTDALSLDAVWLQMSTVGPAGARRLAAEVPQVHERLLDAPVLGTRQPAEDGKLVVLVSGPTKARAKAAPVLEAIGSRTVDVGKEVGAASALKLACNSWVATVNAGTAQALALTSALGLDPALFLEAVKGGPVDAPYVQLKGALMIEESWDTPSFAVDGVRKDVTLMIEAAKDAGVPAKLLKTLLTYYDRASEAGLGGADMAAVRAAFR